MATPKVTLTQVEYSPEPETVELAKKGERDCMPRFLIRGKYGTRAFACYVCFEIDGRDAEYDQISGLDMGFDTQQDRWDALISVLDEYPGFTEKFEELSSSYYEAGTVA